MGRTAQEPAALVRCRDEGRVLVAARRETGVEAAGAAPDARRVDVGDGRRQHRFVVEAGVHAFVDVHAPGAVERVRGAFVRERLLLVQGRASVPNAFRLARRVRGAGRRRKTLARVRGARGCAGATGAARRRSGEVADPKPRAAAPRLRSRTPTPFWRKRAACRSRCWAARTRRSCARVSS